LKEPSEVHLTKPVKMAYFISALFSLSALVALAMCRDYYQLPGQFVDISAKGEELWALDRNRNVHRFDFNQGKWNPIPANVSDGVTSGLPNTIGASQDGWTWITTTPTNKIYRYNVDSKKWEVMGGPHSWAFQINAISKDDAVCAGGGEKVWTTAYDVNRNPTSKTAPISGDLLGHFGAIGEYNEIWLLEKGTKNVWRSSSGQWAKLPGVSPARDPTTKWVTGAAETIDVQSPTRGVMTTTGGRVYMWNGKRWEMLPVENAAKATIGSNRVFILDQVENVIMVDL